MVSVSPDVDREGTGDPFITSENSARLGIVRNGHENRCKTAEARVHDYDALTSIDVNLVDARWTSPPSARQRCKARDERPCDLLGGVSES
jgi:hypothetical protein